MSRVSTKIISSVNLKGGVGKTTIAVSFAAYLGSIGKKTLLVDLDPQTNATFSCISVSAWDKHSKKNGTVANLLGVKNTGNAEGKAKPPQKVMIRDVFPKVDLIPSHLDLFSIDLDLAAAPARESRLKKALTPIIDQYEYIICDCPPNLTIPTQNALAVSTHYIVPICPDFLSSLGVGILLNRIKELGEALETQLQLAGMVISRVGRTAQSRELTVKSLRAQFKSKVLKSQLKERVKVAEAAAKNISVFDAGDAVAAQEFTNVCKELLGRIK